MTAEANTQSVGAASSPTGLWVWLFPLAYGLHIAEEYWFHFPAYVAKLSGRRPGTVTAALLYVPLVAYALRQVLPHVSRGLAGRAAALGAVIHAGVMLLAANPSLIPRLP